MNPATQATRTLPIFPLGTVLFPGGVLPLRIFEARYMDMVRDCLKNESEFGVCLITDGREVGQPADHESIGCTARIEHWDMVQLGLLNIRTRGEQRFEIQSRELAADGLIMAQVADWAPEPEQAVPPQYGVCVQLLQRIVCDVGNRDSDPMRQLVAQPYCYESAPWVSNRLSELLPIPMSAKAALLAMEDPIARLQVIKDYLHHHQLL
ncbi:MAG: LON peptidase substrate-binding domain-containing protein [Burkholderiaceae bacterium]